MEIVFETCRSWRVFSSLVNNAVMALERETQDGVDSLHVFFALIRIAAEVYSTFFLMIYN